MTKEILLASQTDSWHWMAQERSGRRIFEYAADAPEQEQPQDAGWADVCADQVETLFLLPTQTGGTLIGIQIPQSAFAHFHRRRVIPLDASTARITHTCIGYQWNEQGMYVWLADNGDFVVTQSPIWLTDS